MIESQTAPKPLFVDRYIAAYGPYAFGIVSLLIIWFAIVQPELENNRVSTSEIRSVADTQRRTAELLERTALRLEAVAGQLERIKTP